MGSKIELFNNVAAIEGVFSLSGADVQMTDLRAGASLVLAALAAEGSSTIYGLAHLKRGYDNFPEKLRVLGASVI